MAVTDRTDRLIGRLAGRNHGVVTRRELLAAGVTRHQIEGRLKKGALLIQHPGVYRVGHRAPSFEAEYLAAVRSCGDGAVLICRAAAHLYGITRGVAPPPEIASRTERRVEGVRARRWRKLAQSDVTRFRGIPTTTVPRTLTDLATELNAEELGRACHEAAVKYRTTLAEVEAVLSRRPRCPGGRKLRAILTGETPITLSKLESAFLRLLRENGLPLPLTNRRAGGRLIDCRWPDRKLTVELDGYRYHHTRHAWEQDRRREREARARGDDFRRYTYGDVFEQPALMLGELRLILA